MFRGRLSFQSSVQLQPEDLHRHHRCCHYDHCEDCHQKDDNIDDEESVGVVIRRICAVMGATLSLFVDWKGKGGQARGRLEETRAVRAEIGLRRKYRSDEFFHEN